MTSTSGTDEKAAARFDDAIFDWCVHWVPEVRDASLTDALAAFAHKAGTDAVAMRWAVIAKRPVDTHEQRRAVLHDRAYTVVRSFVTNAKVSEVLRPEDRKRLEGVNVKRQVPAVITVKVEGASEAAPGRSDTRMYFFKRGARTPTSERNWQALLIVQRKHCLFCDALGATVACAGGCKWNYCSEQHRDEHANRHKTLCAGQGAAEAVNTRMFERLVDGVQGIER